MSFTSRVLLGLAAGLGLGAWAAASGSAGVREAALWVEPAGTLWTRAIQLTVLPLVVSLLFSGVAGGGGGVGRRGGRAAALFVAMLAATAALALVLAPAGLALVPLDPAGAAALRVAATPPGTAPPGFVEWLTGLVPANLAKAAADGAMLPVIVATLLFAAAATRAAPERRALLVSAADAVADTTLVLVRWVLALAPLGVFALALPLAARLGASALGAVAAYVGVTAALCAVVVALLYPLAALGGRVGVGEFARAAAPAQAVAFSSRSSLASLPAMVEGVRALRLAPEAASFFLPLAVSLFRLAGGISFPVGALFVARLYGVELSAAQLATVGAAAVLLPFSVPGIPGGFVLVIAPILLAVGLPAEGIGILLGVDTLPDMFRTATNVTGHMAAATVLGRRRRGAIEPAGTGET